MPPTRILVGDLPEILREILLDALSAEPGLEVVTASDRETPESSSVHFDLAVTMIDDGISQAYRELFRRHPGLKLLGLKAHGRDAFLVELQPRREALGQLRLDELVRVIRDAARRPDQISRLVEM